MSKLAATLKKNIPANSPTLAIKQPAWKGPAIDGVTQSLIHSYLACKERFRIKVIEGLKPIDTFQVAIEYGNLWHICEENFAARQPWEQPLKLAASLLAKTYPTQVDKITTYYNACRLQFPIYIDYWRKQPDVKQRKPIFQEKIFEYDYELPSQRTVKLRGKLDSCDYIGKAIYLQENKTKSEVDEEKLIKQLSFDFQTMYYIFVLDNDPSIQPLLKGNKVDGVRYNVIRRPLSGGKGTISRHKATKNKPAETEAAYYERLRQVFLEDPASFFVRFRSEISDNDKERFNHECFIPVLENLCDDYEWWSYCKLNNENPFNYLLRQKRFSHHLRQYRLPYGGYNPVADGRIGDLDEYLRIGNVVGLQRVETFFPEL
jgi:PD-(D/E)XK nuclease superfamily